MPSRIWNACAFCLSGNWSLRPSTTLPTRRYKRVVATIDAAKFGLREAEVAVDNTRIVAPFDGTVLKKNADVGEIVAPLAGAASSKAAVVTIADMSSLEVDADVSEANITRVTPEQACEITLDAYPQQRYPGYVTKIVPTADRAKATVLVKIKFRQYDQKVLPEMSAKISFLSCWRELAAPPNRKHCSPCRRQRWRPATAARWCIRSATSAPSKCR